MKRRSFLHHLAASSVLPWIPAWGALTGSPDGHAYGHPDLLGILDDAEAIRAIGHAYRKQFPAHDDVHTVRLLLKAEAQSQRSLDAAAALSACVQADFAHGRIVQLDGWVLSVTEARQCALYSFLPS